MSQELSRTENSILGALTRLDDFLLNPLKQGHCGTTPKTSRYAHSTNQGPNEDDSHTDSHLESGIFQCQAARNSSPEEPHDMMTGVHEKVTYCSPSTYSGKQKKNRSTSQPQFRSENTPATIEANQILLTLQPLANNNNSANFQNKSNRTSKIPKSLTTTMHTFDGKSEKFELFENLFQTSLKLLNQLAENNRINYFHSLMRGYGLQSFENLNGPTPENLGEILAVFPRNYVKTQSMVTAKHKIQKIYLNPVNQNLVDFLAELQKLAKDAFGIAAYSIIEQILFAKMPPDLKKSFNQVHLEKCKDEQFVTHLDMQLELIGLEAPEELQTNAMTKHATKANADRPKLMCSP